MHVRRKSWLRTLSALALAVSAAGAATADPVADFYKGKTVSLIAGFPPGGGYDTYVRVLARHYGRFLPGNPTVVASNMPGAGSLTAANNIYAKFAPDGLALAMFASSAAMEPLIGNKAALFDATRFSWVGSMSQDVAYCGVWQHPGGATTFDEMLTKETIIGGGAPAAITYQASDGAQECAESQFQGHPGLQGHARHQHRHAARRGERHLRHVRLLGEGAVRSRGGRRAHEAVHPDGEQALGRVRKNPERVRLRQDRRGPRHPAIPFRAVAARPPAGRATWNSRRSAERRCATRCSRP